MSGQCGQGGRSGQASGQSGLVMGGAGLVRDEDLIARRCASADEVADWVKQQADKGSGHDLRVAKAGLSTGFKSSDNSTRLRQSAPSTMSMPSTESTASIKSITTSPEITANAVLVLTAAACGLLDRQLTAQAKAFEKEGGFTERLYRRRVQRRSSN